MTNSNQHSDQLKVTENVYELLVQEKRRRRELEEQLEAARGKQTEWADTACERAVEIASLKEQLEAAQQQLERCRERMENILLDLMGTSGPKLYELREFLDREFPVGGSNPASEPKEDAP